MTFAGREQGVKLVLHSEKLLEETARIAFVDTNGGADSVVSDGYLSWLISLIEPHRLDVFSRKCATDSQTKTGAIDADCSVARGRSDALESGA